MTSRLGERFVQAVNQAVIACESLGGAPSVGARKEDVKSNSSLSIKSNSSLATLGSWVEGNPNLVKNTSRHASSYVWGKVDRASWAASLSCIRGNSASPKRARFHWAI